MKNLEIKNQEIEGSKKEDASSKKDASLKKSSKNIQKDIESRLRDIPKNAGFQNSPQIYKIENWDSLSDKDKKSYRRKMRSKIEKFKNDILGKDRSDSERKDAIKRFNAFFKENYLAKDISLNAISQSNNPSKRKDLEDMIWMIQNFK